MDIETYREYCLSKPLVSEETPFGPETLVYKVAGKMFTATDISLFESINLKAPTGEIPELMAEYPAVQPGYHMSKKHWITVLMDGSLPDRLIFEWIDRSYLLVVNGLPLKIRNSIQEELGY